MNENNENDVNPIEALVTDTEYELDESNEEDTNEMYNVHI